MASETLKNDFESAVEKVRNTSGHVSDDKKLRMYALYKQATKGDAPKNGPWAFQIVEHTKWTAWRSLCGKTNEAAMVEYIAETKTLFLNP